MSKGKHAGNPFYGRWFAIGLASFAFLLLVDSANSKDGGPQEQQISQLVEEGAEILLAAFESRTKVTHGQKGEARVSRWDNNFRLSINGFDENQLAQISSLLNEARVITGISSRWDQNITAPFYDSIIVLGTDKTIRKALSPHLRPSVYKNDVEKSTCPYWGAVSEDLTEFTFTGAIFDKNAIPIHACIYMHVAGVYGLTTDYGWYDLDPGVWERNDTSRFLAFTRILLQTMYHPDIKIGMPLDEAEPIIRRILRDLFTEHYRAGSAKRP